MNNKNPKFTRTDSHKQKKLGTKWRKPKGIQNKRRLNHRGYAATVRVGYGRGNQGKIEGKTPVIVNNTKDLESVSKEHIIIIASNVGGRKKLDILNAIKEKGLNCTLNVDDAIATIKDRFEKRTKEKKDKVEEKEKKAKEAEKKKKEAEKKAEEKAEEKSSTSTQDKETSEKPKENSKEKKETPKDEDEKTAKKKELDKVLTKKGASQ
jgi:large subunit ribosomal protein L32e